LLSFLLCFSNAWGQSDALIAEAKQLFRDSSEISAVQIVQQRVESTCGPSFKCRYEHYLKIRLAFEKGFELGPSIVLSELAIRECKDSLELQKEANLKFDLYRYYEALGLYSLASRYVDSSEVLFEQLGDIEGILNVGHSRARLLGYTSSFSDGMKALTKLLKECEGYRDTVRWIRVAFDLIELSMIAGQSEEIEARFLSIRRMIGKMPKEDVAWAWQKLHMRNWDYYLARGDTNNAISHLDSAEALVGEVNDRFIETSLMVTRMYLLVQQYKWGQAKEQFQKVEQIAKEYQMQTILHNLYDLREKIAVGERDYKSAYLALNAQKAVDSIEEVRKGDFNIDNYFLRLEQKKLERESLRQEFQLNLTITIVVLISLIAGILFWAFGRQRKSARQLESQNLLIQQQSEELKELDQLKAQFFSNITHELRTPLTLVLAPLQRLSQSKNLAPQDREWLHSLKQGANQLSFLVEKLVDFGKLRDDDTKLNLSETKVFNFFSSLLSQFESQAEQRNIDFSYHINIDQDLVVKIDQEKCRVVLFNFLSNAFKFTFKGGSVKVLIGFDDNNLLSLEVRDTGLGISQDDQKFIFSRYFQSTDPEKRLIGGTGIGLALCAEYAKLMKGKISFESEENKGTTFHFVIPAPAQEINNTSIASLELEEEDEIASTEVETIEIEQTNTGAHILVVEDNVDLQAYISSVLKDNYRVSLASNGKEAFGLLKQHADLSLVISDLMMPVMDGQTLLQNLKSLPRTKDIPIIMLTARTEVETKLKALRFGVDDYMSKPFDDRELIIRIENLLSRHAIRSQELQKSDIAEEGYIIDSNDNLGVEDQKWLQSFEAYLRENLKDSSLRIPDVAQALSVSESGLFRKVKSLVGITPKQYLDELRLDQARELLESKVVNSIKVLAAQVGYSEPRTFSRNYYKRFGKYPSDY